MQGISQLAGVNVLAIYVSQDYTLGQRSDIHDLEEARLIQELMGRKKVLSVWYRLISYGFVAYVGRHRNPHKQAWVLNMPSWFHDCHFAWQTNRKIWKP